MCTCPGETAPKPRQPGGQIEAYQVKRCQLHKHCNYQHAWVRDGLCDVCTACKKGARRCHRCRCIDYEHNQRKCDACINLIERPPSTDGPRPYTEKHAGPEFKETITHLEGDAPPRTYCLVCMHFKKRPENKEGTRGRSMRLREERQRGFWPGLVHLRRTMPEYVDSVEAAFQKYYEDPGSTTDLILLMAHLGIYVSDEMKLRVYYNWKKRCGYVK